MTFVVGYTTINVTSGKWYMVSLSFEGLANTAGAPKINLQDVVKGDFRGGMTSTGASADCPEIQVWDPEMGGGLGGYTYYYFWTQSRPAATYKRYWAGSNLVPQWSAAQNIWLNVGQSVWFRCYDDCTVTCAGQVAEVSSDPITTKVGKWNMIANPYPKDLVLNSDVNWAEAGLLGGTSSTGTGANCPEIQVWDSEMGGGLGGYTYYYFWSQSRPTPTYKKYWATSDLVPQYRANLSIPVGRGFWLKYNKDNSSTGEDLTFSFKK